LALRHFERLSNDETAQVLDLTKSAASNRDIRALKRIKEILSSIPGLKEQLSRESSVNRSDR
jgi:RNA polymerase sigma-70 factor, ECF subfamily